MKNAQTCALSKHVSPNKFCWKLDKLDDDRSFAFLATIPLTVFNVITFQLLEKRANINAQFMASALQNLVQTAILSQIQR